MAVNDYVLKEKDYIINLRRFFHTYPEVSLKEFGTCKRIEEELSKLKIPFKRVGETGVYASIEGKKAGVQKRIALRADIDALGMKDLKEEEYASKNNGACHACGHDAHTATLLAAAKILKEKEREFSGEVRLFFQQGEEVGGGARQFVKAGLLENVDRVYGAHVSSKLKSGKVAITAGEQSASCDYFKITIKGLGAHMSTPQLGIDSAYIAAQIVVNLQTIASRLTNPLESIVVGVGRIEAGTQYNILAENAVIEGTTRSFNKGIRTFVNNQVISISENIAKTYGAKAEVVFLDFAAPLVNNKEVCDEVLEVAKEIIDEEDIVTNYPKALGADDFADYLSVTKGMYAFIGTANEDKPNTNVAHHNGFFDIDEDALLLSCNLYVNYALKFLG